MYLYSLLIILIMRKLISRRIDIVAAHEFILSNTIPVSQNLYHVEPFTNIREYGLSEMDISVHLKAILSHCQGVNVDGIDLVI